MGHCELQVFILLWYSQYITTSYQAEIMARYLQSDCVQLKHNILNLSLFYCMAEIINLNQHLAYIWSNYVLCQTWRTSRILQNWIISSVLLNMPGFKDNASIVDLGYDDITTFEHIWIFSINQKVESRSAGHHIWYPYQSSEVWINGWNIDGYIDGYMNG